LDDVLSIGKLATGQANYYLEQARGRVDAVTSVRSGVEDYYFDGPEPDGEWMGGGATSLRLGGKVAETHVRRVLAGRDPHSDWALLPATSAVRVPGFDVTFSAPKSVSVLLGIGDEPIRQEIRAAHEVAVADALGYLERHAAVARRGRGGAVSVQGSGFVAAAFQHRLSRAADPQLHTHVLVANMTRGPDGRWTALDGRRIYRHAKTAGYLYEARLRAELTRRLGLEWDDVHKGIADVAGMPKPLLRAFSQRRAEIEAELSRRGETSAEAARVATLATRRAKDRSVSPATLVPEWRRRAAGLGFDRPALGLVLGRAESRIPQERVWTALFDAMGAPDGLTCRRSSFTRRDVLQAICSLLPTGAQVSVGDLEVRADDFLASARVVALVAASTAAEALYSTPELLAAEERVIQAVLEGQQAGSGMASDEAVDDALRRRTGLSTEQRAMVRRLTLTGEAVAVVAGKAGAGKTFALDAAREAWEASGQRVVGVAVARRAARELESGAGILSTSLAAMLGAVRDGSWSVPQSTVLVVDEAGMVPTRARRAAGRGERGAREAGLGR
jgi:conjugative relaxase-like TrwC/TraI family protein